MHAIERRTVDFPAVAFSYSSSIARNSSIFDECPVMIWMNAMCCSFRLPIGQSVTDSVTRSATLEIRRTLLLERPRSLLGVLRREDRPAVLELVRQRLRL